MSKSTKLKTAYLTIDDSPSAGFIEKVDYLLEKNVPAVFFCIGKLMQLRPESVIYAIKKGFPIGNHSYTHPYFSNLSLQECNVEIEKTDHLIDALYREAKITRPCKWFRFPYGDKGDGKFGEIFNSRKKSDLQRKKNIQESLKKMGYSQPDFENIDYTYYENAGLLEDLDWHWTFDVMEWSTFQKKPVFGLKNLDKILQRMESSAPKDCRGAISFESYWLTASRSAEIILLHDHDETNTMFPAIIDKLLELPFSFERVI